MTADAPSPRLSFVLPIYNEAKNLERLFEQLVPFAESLGQPFEMLCVDDGSRDDSLRILKQIAARDDRFRIEALPVNKGKGAAVRHGMLAARGELAIFMDADLSTDLKATGPLLAELENGTDVVLGSRHEARSKISRHQPFARELLGKWFRKTSSRIFAPEIHDFTCGFKGFRTPAAREIFGRSRIDGWAFDLELVTIARDLGYRIAQVDVEWQHFGDSKVRVLSAAVTTLRDMGKVALNRALGRYR
jgi:dolichyl-phosphate beta-glucosyltransferase